MYIVRVTTDLIKKLLIQNNEFPKAKVIKGLPPDVTLNHVQLDPIHQYVTLEFLERGEDPLNPRQRVDLQITVENFLNKNHFDFSEEMAWGIVSSIAGCVESGINPLPNFSQEKKEKIHDATLLMIRKIKDVFPEVANEYDYIFGS